MIFDSHAHYDDEQFDLDRDELIAEISKNAVIGVMDCGVDLESSKKSIELSKKNSMFYSAIGVHPEEANKYTEEVYEELKDLTIKNEKVKAIGEIGLDYYWEENPCRETQRHVFKKQMELAKELNLPVIIHDREAHEDTLNILKQYPEVKGVLHCFSGSVEFAKECVKLGYYIGITGVVTFKNSKKIVDVVKEIPKEKLLVETDCPYMAPVPFRGKRNRSDYINYIIERISEIKNININELENVLVENTKNIFNI